MTRKIIIILALLVGLAESLVAGNYTIPAGYRYIKSVGNGALKVYYKDNVYVSVIDLNKAKVNVGNVDEASNGEFVPHFINDWWNDIADWKTLGMYNGQFFNYFKTFYSSTTTLSFPLRSYWRTINSSVDSGRLRTLRVDSYNNVTIHDGYSNDWRLIGAAKELIVGLHFGEDKGYYDSIGRFYIGGIPYNSRERNSYRRKMRYLLFFTAISKTQNQMLNILASWNVMSRDIVMMDGSGSAQMKIGNFKIGGNRCLPNVITIERKGFFSLLLQAIILIFLFYKYVRFFK